MCPANSEFWIWEQPLTISNLIPDKNIKFSSMHHILYNNTKLVVFDILKDEGEIRKNQI